MRAGRLSEVHLQLLGLVALLRGEADLEEGVVGHRRHEEHTAELRSTCAIGKNSKTSERKSDADVNASSSSSTGARAGDKHAADDADDEGPASAGSVDGREERRSVKRERRLGGGADEEGNDAGTAVSDAECRVVRRVFASGSLARVDLSIFNRRSMASSRIGAKRGESCRCGTERPNRSTRSHIDRTKIRRKYPAVLFSAANVSA